MSRGSRNTVRSIVTAVLVIAGVAIAGGIGATVFFVRSRVYSEPARQEDASAQFDRARARFAGQTPLIELASDDQPILHRPPSTERHEIHALRALVYDPSKGTLSHMDLPGWLLRLTSAGGRVRLANLGVLNDEEQRVTLKDLEHQGPGVVLDVSRRGRRILVWTE
jgi:hypothetical protein